MQLHACDRVLEFPSALVMGIVNVTPDSFSDGGCFLDPAAALAQGLRLVEEGAGLLDIGGESTRPGAGSVAEAEELRRVLPVVKQLAAANVPLSIDTQKPAVARAALEAGAVIINDIAANREDDAMWRLAAETGAGYISMHMRGMPQTMQDEPRYDDVVAEVETFFHNRLKRLVAAGVKTEQVVLDPGIGFGKTRAHNLELLANLNRFIRIRRPLLLGASRKSFLGGPVGQRLAGSLACAAHAVAAGAHIIRAHDVCETVRVVETMEAIQSSP